MPGRARGRTTRSSIVKKTKKRLNGCPAERAGGLQVGTGSLTDLKSQWMPGRARGRTRGALKHDDRIDVSMDARPSARADFLRFASRWVSERLNGCPAERAGGRTGRTSDCRRRAVSMDARPSARADAAGTHGFHGADGVSMDARPSARADRRHHEPAAVPIARLNGCPAERAGGQPTHKSFFSSSLEGQTGGPHAFARGLPAKKWGSDDSGF